MLISISPILHSAVMTLYILLNLGLHVGIIISLKNRVNFRSIFNPWVLTSVITSFGVNIEWTGPDETPLVKLSIFIGVIESNEVHYSTSGISSLHGWSELFTRLFRENRNDTNSTHALTKTNTKNERKKRE